MARYVDAELLEESMLGWKPNLNDELIKYFLDTTPTADVVEVVRCKDCKYCFDAIMGGMWCEHPDNIMPLGSNPDDFCSYGAKE